MTILDIDPISQSGTLPGMDYAEPLGLAEVVDMLGMLITTGYVWRRRGELPEPEYVTINGFPAWERLTILEWAGSTGRINDDRLGPEKAAELRGEYRRRFGREPVPWTARQGRSGPREAPTFPCVATKENGEPCTRRVRVEGARCHLHDGSALRARTARRRRTLAQ